MYIIIAIIAFLVGMFVNEYFTKKTIKKLEASNTEKTTRAIEKRDDEIARLERKIESFEDYVERETRLALNPARCGQPMTKGGITRENAVEVFNGVAARHWLRMGNKTPLAPRYVTILQIDLGLAWGLANVLLYRDPKTSSGPSSSEFRLDGQLVYRASVRILDGAPIELYALQANGGDLSWDGIVVDLRKDPPRDVFRFDADFFLLEAKTEVAVNESDEEEKRAVVW